jgi:hypothetical protein
LVRRWISQCCSNSMLQINVQQYTPLVLKRSFTQLLHTANRCKLTLQIVKPLQADVVQYSITIMSVPACVGHHLPWCISFLMLHMDVQQHNWKLLFPSSTPMLQSATRWKKLCNS